MTRRPRLKGKEVVRILERLGFEVIRKRGSRVFLRHSNGRAHYRAGDSGIGPGLLLSILRDIEMSLEEFLDQV